MSKAILLLHGFATNTDDFQKILPFLNETYDFVSLPTLPGHERNNHLRNFKSRQVLRFVNNLCITLFAQYHQVDIIGYSMGGALATYLAGKYPFSKIILLAPANQFLNWKLPIKRMKISLHYYAKKYVLKNNDYQDDKQWKTIKIDDKKGLSILLKNLLPNYTFHSLREFKKLIRYCNRNLKMIVAPTCIFWGDVDQLVPYQSLVFIKQYCLNVEIIIQKNMSHLMLNSQNSSKLIKQIKEFLEK